MKASVVALILVLTVGTMAQGQITGAPSHDSRSTASHESGTNSISFGLYPAVMIPITDSADLFTTGGSATFGAEYAFGDGAVQPFAGLEAVYSLTPFKANDSLSIVSAEAAGGVSLELAPRLLVRGAATAGYYYALINSDAKSGSNPAFSVGFGVQYLLSPILSLSAGASYRNYLGLYHGMSMNFGTSFYLSGRQSRKTRIDAASPIRPELLQGARRPVPGTGVEIQSLVIDDLFPVFHKYYDDHPAGRAVLVNRESQPIDGIKLSFFVKEYMDSAKECPAPEKLGPSESLAVDIQALFTNRILGVTEATKAAAEIVLEYRMNDELYRDVRIATVRVLDRNAMTWDDDRRAAAFVTAKDPAVLTFSKAVAGLVRDRGPQAVNANLLQAIAIFQSLDLYGISYVVDPKSSYSDFSTQKNQVDYLQFPRQTLEFRGGDCDDLSILYTALLESIGVESAFITVPGHIYAAFNLGIPPEEAEKELTNTVDLVAHDGSVWVPVEVTVRRGGFLAAWQTGAREWRDAVSKNAAAFIPVRAAWDEYEPVGLPGVSGNLALPPSDAIVAAFLKETARYVDREIYPKVARLEQDIRQNGGSATTRNRLGILYAKYGKLDDAEAQFTQAIGRGDYAPALINLGNIYYLRKDFSRAQSSYERAAGIDPRNSTALVCLAKLYHDEEKYDLAKTNYDKLCLLDPVVAQRYAYLSTDSSTSGRASVAGVNGGAVWGE
ncbi:MAG TPA: hypothetical protein VMW87_00300 [Spirochaetia bacterium]|nr:hypothetical protein [Spirochaetia bacterium]